MREIKREIKKQRDSERERERGGERERVINTNMMILHQSEFI